MYILHLTILHILHLTSYISQATGRLTWLPLCDYKGNGRVVSLTQAGKEMQVFKDISLLVSQQRKWKWLVCPTLRGETIAHQLALLSHSLPVICRCLHVFFSWISHQGWNPLIRWLWGKRRSTQQGWRRRFLPPPNQTSQLRWISPLFMFIKIVHPISNQTGWSQHCSYQRPLQNLKTLGEVRIRTFIQRNLDGVHFLFHQSHKVGLKKRFRYVVIGAGKTGLDALLQLLDTGASQESILWVISQDCWYFNRWDSPDMPYIIQPWPGIHSWKRMGFRWARQFQSWSVTRPTPSWEPTLSKRSITPWKKRETKVSQSQKKLKKTLKMLIEHCGLRIEHCSSLNVLITHWQGRHLDSFIHYVLSSDLNNFNFGKWI